MGMDGRWDNFPPPHYEIYLKGQPPTKNEIFLTFPENVKYPNLEGGWGGCTLCLLLTKSVTKHIPGNEVESSQNQSHYIQN